MNHVQFRMEKRIGIICNIIILVTVISIFYAITKRYNDVMQKISTVTKQHQELQVKINQLNIRISNIEIIEDKDLVTRYIRSVNPKIFEELAVLQANAFLKYSKVYDVPIGVVVGLACVESRFEYNAMSNKGAIGIMQINPKIWTSELIKNKTIGSNYDLYDPIKNIQSGIQILANYKNQCKKGNAIDHALTRYLGGTENNHYENVMKRCGEYYLFIKQYQKK